MRRYESSPSKPRYPTQIINPTSKSFTDTFILEALLKTHDYEVVFRRHRQYSIVNPITERPVRCTLTNKIIKLKCNPNGKHAGEYRFAVVGRIPLGNGGYGKVYPVTNILMFNQDGHLIEKVKSNDKRRVVKKISYDSKTTKADIFHEYTLSKYVPHLHALPPRYDEKSGYLSMRRFDAVHLGRIISDDVTGAAYLTLEQRFLLCKAILQAVKDQVHDRDIVHRDLSVSNILIKKMADDHYQAFIIDFGLSKIAGAPNRIVFMGITPYHAPEEYFPFNKEFSTRKSDVYTLAHVISRIFRARTLTTDEVREEWKRGIIADGLFSGIYDIDLVSKEQIRVLLSSMGQPVEHKRCTIDDAIGKFELISDRFFRNRQREKLIESLGQYITKLQQALRDDDYAIKPSLCLFPPPFSIAEKCKVAHKFKKILQSSKETKIDKSEVAVLSDFECANEVYSFINRESFTPSGLRPDLLPSSLETKPS
jgi:serine/threonine-protein kinase LegK1